MSDEIASGQYWSAGGFSVVRHAGGHVAIEDWPKLLDLECCDMPSESAAALGRLLLRAAGESEAETWPCEECGAMRTRNGCLACLRDQRIDSDAKGIDERSRAEAAEAERDRLQATLDRLTPEAIWHKALACRYPQQRNPTPGEIKQAVRELRGNDVYLKRAATPQTSLEWVDSGNVVMRNSGQTIREGPEAPQGETPQPPEPPEPWEIVGDLPRVPTWEDEGFLAAARGDPTPVALVGCDYAVIEKGEYTFAYVVRNGWPRWAVRRKRQQEEAVRFVRPRYFECPSRPQFAADIVFPGADPICGQTAKRTVNTGANELPATEARRRLGDERFVRAHGLEPVERGSGQGQQIVSCGYQVSYQAGYSAWSYDNYSCWFGNEMWGAAADAIEAQGVPVREDSQ